MGQVISSGNPEKVSAHLGSMEKASAIRQLTGCYGGRGNIASSNSKKDDHDLYRMTVPILHAAYTGNTSIFSSVHDAMRETLTVQQVRLWRTF